MKVCRKCFDSIESGEAFISYELEEGAVGNIIRGVDESLALKFLRMLGVELTIEFGIKSKFAKHYTKALAKIDYLKIFRMVPRDESDVDEEAEETVFDDEDGQNDEKLKESKKGKSSTPVKSTSKNLPRSKRDFDEEGEALRPMEDDAERNLKKKKKSKKRKSADANPGKTWAISPEKDLLDLHEGAPSVKKKRKSASTNFSETKLDTDEEGDGEVRKVTNKEKTMKKNSANKLGKFQSKILEKADGNSPSNTDLDEAENGDMSPEELKKLYVSMKKAFETEKEEILADIPKKYTDRLNEIAFAKWTKQPYRPVLIVDPYSLSCESMARKQWFQMFEYVSESTVS